MIYFYIVTFGLLLLSFIKDRDKTKRALKHAYENFIDILPDLFFIIIMVSVSLSIISPETIAHYLSLDNKIEAGGLAFIFGSITLMPGFIAFPICGFLLKLGVPYLIIAIFSTSLMLIGIVTLPVEIRFFGKKFAIIRNIFSIFIALIVALIIAYFYGEIGF